MEIEKLLTKGEKVIWKGKPGKFQFITKRVLMMIGIPIALFIPILAVLIPLFIFGKMNIALLVIIPIVIIVSLVMLLIPIFKYKNTHYYITNKRIIIKTGIVGADFKHIELKLVNYVDVNVGILDKLFGSKINSGTLRFTPSFQNMAMPTGAQGVNGMHMMTRGFVLENVDDSYSLYQKVQSLLNK